MFKYLFDSILYVADVLYHACNCVYQFSFTSLARLLQPDIYGATVYSAVAPFRGTSWEFALNSSDSLLAEPLASLMNILNVPPSTTLFEAIFYIVCSCVVLLILVRFTARLLGK